jgi:hypothetical protein
MIDITLFEHKLKMLEVYMDLWLSEKHCMIKWWDWCQDTGVLMNRVEWLPPFDQWYFELIN